MRQLKEAFSTILRASKYSLSFCLRNCKKLTVIRLLIALAATLLSYLYIQATGQLVNAVQKAIENFSGQVDQSLRGFLTSGLVPPILFFFVVAWVTRTVGSYTWFFRSKWNQILRFSNQRELQEHRATLDIARIRSKEYDDLKRRISELPYGWSTRISFSEDLNRLITALVSFVIFGTSLLWYNPIYAVIILVASLPMVIVEFHLNSLWWKLFQDLMPENKKRAVLETPYSGTVAFVQALMFNQMPTLRKKIDMSTSVVLGAYSDIRKKSVKSRQWVSAVTIFGLVVVIAHASWSVITHSGGLGTLTIILAAARTFQNNLEQIVDLVSEQWNSVKGVILIEEEFFGMGSMIETKYPVVPPKDVTPEIRFEGVSFAYPNKPERMVLEDVSFTLSPGSKTAIVGTSGNGKSTIEALLMRHYDPTSGRILVNGIDLRNIRPADWSTVASALTQSYTILERPIGEEIASSRMDDPIDMDELRAAAKFANFEDVVNSDPQGFASQIGTEFGGREFSGGEQQRLAIARVRYRGTPVLILDEPDASLDAESAQKVIDNIFALQGVTVVMITHHVARAEKCDHIIVMGKGKVVEQGSHTELMALNGHYVSIRSKDRERLGGVSSDSYSSYSA